ncbi:aldo/keto reductase [Novosphingobium bradum]|uniref:Aldo/keto reductase n=1 Tax=Novosphingobium bradum TaxID=1737444 RepID=A0ABV7IM08_9SPHN
MKRTLGGRSVKAIGLGCMNLSHAYGPPLPPTQGARVLDRALELGYDHFDTSRLYGGGRNEDLVGRVLKGRRDRVFLASKTGIHVADGRRWIDCSPAAIRAGLDQSLTALGVDHIDLYYLHRPDFTVPIEDSVGALADQVRAGKIGAIGLSEMNAQTLRRAHAVYPVAAMQTEYSPWTRNVEIAVLDTARELGVALVAFSPLGRGALCGTLRDPASLVAGDMRRDIPRFQPDHWPRNLVLIDRLAALAGEAGVSAAQLCLGWVLSRGDHVHAIPGTTRLDHVAENLARADWRPDADLVARVDALFDPEAISGGRYPPVLQAQVETEDFPG